ALSAILITPFGLLANASEPAAAAGAVVLKFDPSSQSTTAGQELTLDLIVSSGSQAVDGVQIELSFPTTMLEVMDTNTSKQGLQARPGTDLPTVLQNDGDNTTGKVWYAAGADLTSGVRPSGDFLLASVKFNAKAAGTAQLRYG